MAVEMLVNKNVLIVGATGGIGSEAAKLIKKSQGNIFITGRNEEKLATLGKALQLPEHRIFTLDVTDPTAVRD
ncbi:MAG: SDR family NAD(P)-dependent oxidoreductase, partial [Mameliella sp.]|nr:SDR family NAD(P)-dependent oxidoreductase [Phaeodactylibacter sp.]